MHQGQATLFLLLSGIDAAWWTLFSSGLDIKHDLTELLPRFQNAQGLMGGLQGVAGVDHRSQAVLRHCRQQGGELSGIA
jgi:hypothetical protein